MLKWLKWLKCVINSKMTAISAMQIFHEERIAHPKRIVLARARFGRFDMQTQNESGFDSSTVHPPDCKVWILEEKGHSNPSPHGTHSISPWATSAMLMNPSWQPQSETDTDPSNAVVACAGHALQRLLPFTSWYWPTGQRLQALLPVLFCWLPAGHGRQKSDAPNSWKCPLAHSWQMKVEPGKQQFGKRNIHQGSYFHNLTGAGHIWKITHDMSLLVLSEHHSKSSQVHQEKKGG